MWLMLLKKIMACDEACPTNKKENGILSDKAGETLGNTLKTLTLSDLLKYFSPYLWMRPIK